MDLDGTAYLSNVFTAELQMEAALRLDARRLSSGVYFVRLAAGDRSRTHQLTLVE